MKYIFICLISFILFSCEKDEQFDNQLYYQDNVVLKDRPSQWKPYIYNKDASTRSSGNQTLGMRDFIGFSFRSSIAPIEDTRNLGQRIIDISSFSRDYPSYFRYWKNLSRDAKVFSYSSFDDYSVKTEMSKKVSHGIDLKLLSFNLGHKSHYTSTFGQTLTNNAKSIFGELNIFVRDSCYRMQYSTNIQKLILKKYLEKSFIEELHSIHPYDFFQNYGEFVAADYSSGGRGMAIYVGTYKKGDVTSTAEKEMSDEINASFTWDNNSLSNNLNLGRGHGSTTSYTGQFSSVKYSVKTLGGSASGSFSIPAEVGNSSIDLSGWVSSLSDNRLNVISEFNQNGLIPISDFILEDNLKKLFNSFSEGNAPRRKTIEEPYIRVTQVNNDINTKSLTTPVIVTRYGEWIPLFFIFGVYDDSRIVEYWKIIDQIHDIFQIKIVNKSAVPPIKTMSNYQGPYIYQFNYEHILSHKNLYTKIVHNGMLYFIDEVDKVGFSILNNTTMIAEYGLTNYISKLKMSSLKYEDLIDQNYVINAL